MRKSLRIGGDGEQGEKEGEKGNRQIFNLERGIEEI